MPFENKKKKDTRKQKNFFFDENNQYQSELLSLLELCGHKQVRFLSLLAHEYIVRNGINVQNLDKNTFKLFLNSLEIQATTGFIPMYSMQNQSMAQMPVASVPAPISKPKTKKKVEEDFIDEDDLDDMNAALAAFGA